MLKRIASYLMLLSMVAVLLVACSDDEDKLVVYTPAGEEMIDVVIPAFEEETGIDVELITAGTGELLNRIDGESDDPYADVMWGGSPSLIRPMEENFEDYVSENDEHLPDAFINTEVYMTRFSTTTSVILVNTDLIGDIEVNGYEDLLNPELKGKIAHGDATASSSSFNHLENMLFAMGKDNDPFSDEAWDYVEKFLENLDGKIASSSGNVHKGVADGEYTVGLTYETPALDYLKDGAPVEVVYMEEGLIFKDAGSYIVKGATNRENAELFNDFLLSKEIQDALGVETSSRPLREDAELAEGKTPLSELTIIDYDDSWGDENADEVIDIYMDILTKD